MNKKEMMGYGLGVTCIGLGLAYEGYALKTREVPYISSIPWRMRKTVIGQMILCAIWGWLTYHFLVDNKLEDNYGPYHNRLLAKKQPKSSS